MGYQKVTLIPGFNFVAPQFTAVGGGPIDLQSIHLDVEDADASGGDSIQVWDADGNGVSAYYWYPADWIDGVKSGWVDETGLRADVDIDPGVGVVIDSTDDFTITVAGEVSTNDCSVTSVAGFNFVGNSTPVTIDIQDIQLDIPDDEVSGGDSIQIWDSDGNGVTAFYWYPADWIDGVKSGWVDETGSRAAVDIDPGVGVVFDASADDIHLTVPSAL